MNILYNPFGSSTNINGNTYTISKEAVEDYRSLFNDPNIPVDAILEDLAKNFPNTRDFKSNHVTTLFKKRFNRK